VSLVLLPGCCVALFVASAVGPGVGAALGIGSKVVGDTVGAALVVLGWLLGCAEGRARGCWLGWALGDAVGCVEGVEVGWLLGCRVGSEEGWLLGWLDGRGLLVGEAVLGSAVGAGDMLGEAVGEDDGCPDGWSEGCADGWLVGLCREGAALGAWVGAVVGARVGALLSGSWARPVLLNAPVVTLTDALLWVTGSTDSDQGRDTARNTSARLRSKPGSRLLKASSVVADSSSGDNTCDCDCDCAPACCSPHTTVSRLLRAADAVPLKHVMLAAAGPLRRTCCRMRPEAGSTFTTARSVWFRTVLVTSQIKNKAFPVKMKDFVRLFRSSEEATGT
jgi:hypothetical protein